MVWPLATDFSIMLQNPRVGLRDPELQKCQVERKADGQPRPWTGAFAVVFKGTFPGSSRAVAIRAFTSEVAERQERYNAISKHLESRTLRCLVKFTYQKDGIRSASNGKWYPLVSLDWVHGETLYDWVRARCLSGDKAALARAAQRWVELIAELEAAEVAHGDLQHGNVMVTDAGELKLVDYDCMCVPALVGKRNLEIGVDPYQHPKRQSDTELSPRLDDFSALFILVVLKALAAAPTLWQEHVERPGEKPYDKLLIRPEDLQEPRASRLYQDLQRSPDPEVGELAHELFALAHLPLGHVPPLARALNSFTRIQQFLTQRDWDGAVDLIQAKTAVQRAQAPPALQSAMKQAERRVTRRKELERAAEQGDEQALVRLYDPGLLDDYPRAQAAVQVARSAATALQAITRLREALQKNEGRRAVDLWDAQKTLLGTRKSTETLRPMIEKWRGRNQACDHFLAAVRQPSPDENTLAARWRELENVTGHPDAESYRTRMQQLLGRLQAWSAFRAVPRQDEEAADLALDRAWNEGLFAGWPTAEAERPRLEEARRRLAVLAQLRQLDQQSAGRLTPSGERAFVDLADQQLPPAYVYTLRVRVQGARDRLRVVEDLRRAMASHEPTDTVATCWEEIVSLGGEALVPPAHQKQALHSVGRAPLLVALRELDRNLPANELDRKILQLWQPELLNSCAEAKPWQSLYERAEQRRPLLKQLKAAVAAHDDLAIAAGMDSPLLKGYPLPREWVAVIKPALERTREASALVSALQQKDEQRFHDAFNADVIRRYSALFQPHHALLKRWLETGILPLGKIGLAAPAFGRTAVLPLNGEEAFKLTWTWPQPRFTEVCLLAVCRSKPRPQDRNPEALATSVQLCIDRKGYEGAGSWKLHHRAAWGGGYAVVWAEVDLGFQTFYSEPLVLGPLSRPTSGGASAKRW